MDAAALSLIVVKNVIYEYLNVLLEYRSLEKVTDKRLSELVLKTSIHQISHKNYSELLKVAKDWGILQLSA